MKKFLKDIFIMFLLIFACKCVFGQSQPVYQLIAPGVGVSASGSSLGNKITATGAAFHQIAWYTIGSLSSCSVQVDSSADGISWAPGGAVTAQNCATNGSFLNSVSTVVNFVRVTYTLGTGGGLFYYTAYGYINNPTVGGAGSVTSVNGSSAVGIFTITGGPINGAGTLVLNASGVSGGIPYFVSSNNLSSSGTLASGFFVLGGGAGVAPTAQFSVVPQANGGTGTTNPSLQAGTNITITGTWPNQVISGTGSGSTSSSCPNTTACQDATKIAGALDICDAISKSFLALPNGQGTVDARGFTGAQACTLATATGAATNGMIPNANCQNVTQGGGSCSGATISKGKIELSNTLQWFLPVGSSGAGNVSGGAGSKVNYDRLGTIIIPNGVTIEGTGNSAAGSSTGQTQIIACQSAGYLGNPNCPAPSTQEIYQISSIVVTQETAAPGRNYAHVVTATQSDIVAGQPFRISGALASGNSTMVDFNNSYTACESSAFSDVVTDPACGGGAGGQNTTGFGDIYFPVSSGIAALVVTAVGSGYGSTPPTCSLPAPTNAGGVQATCIATISGGSVSGLYLVNRGTGYAAGTAAGTVTLSGNATATYQTIPASCTRGANVNCGYLYGELPLLHFLLPSNGTGAGSTQGVGVSMGQHLTNINVDCKFVPTCIPFSSRSAQENSQVKDSWFGNSFDRAIDFHGFQTQNSDALNGNRETMTSLANRQKSITTGSYTFGAGTLSLTVGSNTFIPFGVYYIWNAPAGLTCAGSVNMNAVTIPTYPTYIPLVALSVTGNTLVLDDSGTNCATSGTNTATYNVGEVCEPGTEIIYLGDVGPHGIQDNTADYSNCGVNSSGFPTAYNAAVRINTNSTHAPYLMGGHAEDAIYGILAGDSNAFRGMSITSWAGIPTPNVGSFGGMNQAGGQYQSEIGSSAIKIRSEFNTAANQKTTDYIISNSISNNSSGLYYTVNDDNPINALGTDGCHVQDSVTSMYAVDLTPAGEVMISTTSCGNNFGVGAAIAPGKGGNAAIFQGLTGGTAVGFTANTVAVFGNYYIQNALSGMTHLNWNISVADASGDLYDIGLYGPCAPAQANCPLVVHIGATAGTTFAPAPGLLGGTIATIPTVVTLLPGNYYLAGTCNSGCTATLVTGPTQMQLVSANSATASASGILPATITIPGQSIKSASLPQMGIH